MSITAEQMDEIRSLSKAINNSTTRLDARMDALEMRMNRPGMSTGGSMSGPAGGEMKTLGRAVREALRGNDAELKSMALSPDSSGGYLSVPQLDNMITMVREQIAPVSSLARNVPIDAGAAFEMPIIRGTLESGWVSEQASRAATATRDVGQARIELNEVYCMPQVTQRLLDDANYDIGGLLLDMIGHGLSAATELAIVSGDGIVRPRGFTTLPTAATADSSRAWGTFEHVNTGASGAFKAAASDPADCLFELVEALQPQYRANARWLMSRSTFAVLRKLKAVGGGGAGGGQYLLEPSVAAGAPPTLLGYPVTISDNVPAIGAGSLSVWFGDMRQAYVVVTRPGIKLLRDPYSTKGQVAFYAYMRVGGAPVNFDALKALRFGS